MHTNCKQLTRNIYKPTCVNLTSGFVIAGGGPGAAILYICTVPSPLTHWTYTTEIRLAQSSLYRYL